MRTFGMAVIATVAMLGVSAVSAQRDALMCYKAGADFGGAVAHFDDDDTSGSGCGVGECPGESKTFSVAKVKDYCVPAGVNGDAINNSADHYVFYSVKRASGECSGNTALACGEDADCGGAAPCFVYATKYDKKNTKNLSTFVTDGLENLRIDFNKEIGVLAPAASGMPAPADGTKNYYKCYAVKPTKASCSGGSNDGEVCKDPVVDCGGAPCQANPKFPKETNFSTDGVLPVSLDDTFLGGETDFEMKKLKMFCQAADKNASSAPEQEAGMLCYAGKAVSGPGAAFVAPAIQTVSTQFAPGGLIEVKKPEMFCNGACVEPSTHSFTTHIMRVTSLNIPSNGQLRCVGGSSDNAACVSNAGCPGGGSCSNALNVDGLATCQPGGCNNGLDNQLGLLTIAQPAINAAIQQAVDEGSINWLLEADTFADGTQVINDYTGNLAGGSCPSMGDNSNPALSCHYLIDSGSMEIKNLTSCRYEAENTLPVTISGSANPTGYASGGGAGTEFVISLRFGDHPLTLTAHNAKVAAAISQSAGVITGANGVIGGAVVLSEVMSAIVSLDDAECEGGVNDGAECTSPKSCAGGLNPGAACDSNSDCQGGGTCLAGGVCSGGDNVGAACESNGTCTGGGECNSPNEATECPGGNCNYNYLNGLSKSQLKSAISILPADQDLDGYLNCVGATNNNEICGSCSAGSSNPGDPCGINADCPGGTCTTLSCPDINGVCQLKESASLAIRFKAIDADIDGIN